ATSTATPAITTASPQPRCSDGYTLYSGPGRSFFFRFSNIYRPWESAQRFCQIEHTQLLVLDNDSLSPFGDVLRQQFA
ncbi:hypothetical protein ACJMK2_002928, partial [Sinanodonta woodiana]